MPGVLNPTQGVPQQNIYTINDLVSEVINRVENRTSDTDRAAIWLRDALLELTGNPDFRDDFSELEIFGPIYTLTPNTQEYSETLLMPTDVVNQSTLAMLAWIDPPANRQRRKLDMSHYQSAYKYSTVGMPTEWYRFAKAIGFNPAPSLAYQVQMLALKKHPISENVNSTALLIPQDWNEVLVWAAAERGFMELEQFEKASNIHTFLFGDPKSQNPGFIYGRKKQRSQEAWRQEQPLRPRVPRYGAR